jgi:hypothetical protein
MDRMRNAFLYFIFTALVFLPSLSSAGVKVLLKNGREIIADSCEGEGERLVCVKMGGTFVIEKDEIEQMKETGGGNDAFSGGPADDRQPEQEKEPEDVRGAEGTDKENPSVSGQTGAEKRLAEIMQKKKDLYAEREKLVKERQQFQEDLKKAPDWMPTKRYEELEKRNTEISEKIKRFNEEAARLKEEEDRLVEGRNKKD